MLKKHSKVPLYFVAHNWEEVKTMYVIRDYIVTIYCTKDINLSKTEGTTMYIFINCEKQE